MKLLVAIVTTLILAGIMVSAALAANQYAETSAKLKEVLSDSLGLAAFRPRITMIDEQLRITLSPTLGEIIRHLQMFKRSSSFTIRSWPAPDIQATWNWS